MSMVRVLSVGESVKVRINIVRVLSVEEYVKVRVNVARVLSVGQSAKARMNMVRLRVSKVLRVILAVLEKFMGSKAGSKETVKITEMAQSRDLSTPRISHKTKEPRMHVLKVLHVTVTARQLLPGSSECHMAQVTSSRI